MFNPVLSLELLYLALCEIFGGVVEFKKYFRGSVGLNQFINYIDAVYRSALATPGMDVSFINPMEAANLIC